MKIYAKAQLDECTWISVPLDDDNVFLECPLSGEELPFPLLAFLKKHHFLEWNIKVPPLDPGFQDEEKGEIDSLLITMKEIMDYLRTVFHRAVDLHEHQ